MKRSIVVVILALTALPAEGCAGHRIPEPGGAHSTAPHISWSIHASTADDPEQLTVCESEPQSDCIVGANRPDNQFFASVHLYLHAGPAETTYTGVMRIGFFQGSSTANQTKVNATVKPGDEPGRMFVYDRLPSNPGVYPFEIDLVASVTGSGEQLSIHQRADVIVR